MKKEFYHLHCEATDDLRHAVDKLERLADSFKAVGMKDTAHTLDDIAVQIEDAQKKADKAVNEHIAEQFTESQKSIGQILYAMLTTKEE